MVPRIHFHLPEGDSADSDIDLPEDKDSDEDTDKDAALQKQERDTQRRTSRVCVCSVSCMHVMYVLHACVYTYICVCVRVCARLHVYACVSMHVTCRCVCAKTCVWSGYGLRSFPLHHCVGVWSVKEERLFIPSSLSLGYLQRRAGVYAETKPSQRGNRKVAKDGVASRRAKLAECTFSLPPCRRGRK